MCQSNCDNYKNTGELTGDNGGGGGEFQVETGSYNDMYSKTGMVAGDLFMAIDSGIPSLNKLFYYSGNTWQCSGETAEFTAEENLSIGQLIEVSPTNDLYVKKTNTLGDIGFIGVVMNTASAGNKVSIGYAGVHYVSCRASTYTRALYLRPSSTNGLAQQTSSAADEPFAKILQNTTVNTDGGLVLAFLHTQEIY